MKTLRAYSKQVWFWVLAVLGLLILIAVIHFLIKQQMQKKNQFTDVQTVILSPHFDDAVLSLGGLMAKHEHPIVVATFFTETPLTATTTHWDSISGFSSSTDVTQIRTEENVRALKLFNATIQNYDYQDFQYGRTEPDDVLEADIAKDVQALIVRYSQGSTTVNIYGPAYFTKDITHPDHALLHRAFLDVADNYPNPNVHFYMYEDFPYVQRYMNEATTSLEKNLERDSGDILNEEQIMLTARDVSEKIQSLKEYASQTKAFQELGTGILLDAQNFTLNRCGTKPQTPCEVVYSILP